MKFKVVGQNRETGARTSVEVEADSKAAAERKATQAGMNVHHITDIDDETGGARHTNYRGPVRTGGSGVLFKLVVLILVLAVLGWYFWPKINVMINR